MKYYSNFSINWSWLAGFIDGEGCVSITKNDQSKQTSPAYRVNVNIAQRERQILDEIKDFIGYGHVAMYNKGPHRFQLTCGQACKFLQDILPCLKIKQLQARLVLQFQKYKSLEIPLSKRELRWREMHYRLCQLYKRENANAKRP